MAARFSSLMRILIFLLPARQALGRAKMAAEDGWQSAYDALEKQMKQETTVLKREEAV